MLGRLGRASLLLAKPLLIRFDKNRGIFNRAIVEGGEADGPLQLIHGDNLDHLFHLGLVRQDKSALKSEFPGLLDDERRRFGGADKEDGVGVAGDDFGKMGVKIRFLHVIGGAHIGNRPSSLGPFFLENIHPDLGIFMDAGDRRHFFDPPLLGPIDEGGGVSPDIGEEFG